jgi:hypothetical protein
VTLTIDGAVTSALNVPLTLPVGGATTVAAVGIASIARAIETTAIAAAYPFMVICPLLPSLFQF